MRYTLAAVYLVPDAIFRYELGGETGMMTRPARPEEIADTPLR